ncbi:MAG: hypothetical protein ACOX6O_11635 [Christensenellales bacterium]|jgi:hypothetical protein
MRAKILMLSDSIKSKSLLRTPQQALSDIAVAFGHSFVMKDQQLEEVNFDISPDEYQAVIAAVSEEELLDVFDARWRIRSLRLPDGLADFSLLRIPRFPAITLVSPMQTGLQSALLAAEKAFQIAGEMGAMVWAVADQGAPGVLAEAVSRAASPYALSSPEAVPVESVVAKPLQHPDKNHVFLADRPTAELLFAIFRGLSGAGLSYSIYGDESTKIHLAGGVSGFAPGLFDALYATVTALESSLHLKKEAGCLRASVDNVLASGWRSRDMNVVGESAGDEQIAALIGEQIELAGSLMQRFPG